MSRITVVTIKYHWFPVLLLIVPDFMIKGILRKAIAKHEDPLIVMNDQPIHTSHPIDLVRELPRGLIADVRLKGTWSFVLRRL